MNVLSLLALSTVSTVMTVSNAYELAEDGIMGSTHIERLDHSVSVVIEGDNVVIEMKGKADSWFGFGFDTEKMEGAYAIIVSDQGIKEYFLSKWSLDQSENAVHPTGLETRRDEIVGEHRIVEVTRPRHLEHFTFPNEEMDMGIIYAKGGGLMEVGYHGYENRGSDRLDLVASIGFGEGEGDPKEPERPATKSPTSKPTEKPSAPTRPATKSPTAKPTAKPNEPARSSRDRSSSGRGGDSGSTRGSSSSRRDSGSSSRDSGRSRGGGSVLEAYEAIGCVWDGTGCFGDCDVSQMNTRCAEMDTVIQCESDKGAQKRCRWDYGSRAILKQYEDEDGSLTAFQAIFKPHASSMGCVWDGTGCFGDCDTNQMKERCAEMESQTQCESDNGAQKRCRWDYGISTSFNYKAFVVGRAIGMETDISAVNMLLVVGALVTVLFAVRQVYRWYRNREYRKLNEVEMAHELGGTAHIAV